MQDGWERRGRKEALSQLIANAVMMGTARAGTGNEVLSPLAPAVT